MSFELNIKSSKDITSLSINFADGTSTVTSSNKVEKIHKEPKNNSDVIKDDHNDHNTKKTRGRKEQFLDTEADYSSLSQEVVQLPKIDVINRPVKVAEELQNLDF